ncbi:AAA family ATPase [Corynebacterium tuscaniense]|uniref:AAA family ATPase n=1 Tax=Corynebacterium tuscaniense TaxID=302449 RepID=UPI00123B5719|nr:AAA family ATPase [Corynebacterium tuscaniense]KAA8745046.1 AAA domain-containing protein [Corynebacterium tuscaniense]
MSDQLSAVTSSRPQCELNLATDVRPITEQMLGDGYSILDSSLKIWVSEVAEELRRRIEDNPIHGKSQTQWEKLREQLTGAAPEVILLAAEIAILREHPTKGSQAVTRRQHLEDILGILDHPIEIPSDVVSWMSTTSNCGFKPGQSYYGSLWRQIIWVANFIKTWDSQTPEQKASVRQDPWAIEKCMLDSGEDRSDIRNALQFLIFPEYFEPISSQDMKTRIRDAFADRLSSIASDSPLDVDQDLLRVRHSLGHEISDPFHFWSPQVRPMWDKDAIQVEPDEEARGTHYWLFAPGKGGENWEAQYSDGVMAIGWEEVGDLSQYSSRDQIRKALPADQNGPNNTLALWEFQNSIQPGDIIFAKRGRKEVIGRGRVTSEARHEPGRTGFPNVRDVEWTDKGQWEHPGDAATKTLTDITRYTDYVKDLESLFGDDPSEGTPVAEHPPYSKEQFLKEVYLPEEKYDRLRSLLMRKKNVILAGPPGVGKTFSAKRLAYSIMGEVDKSRILTVQFHQSFSYEDFIMGYRPTESGGFKLEYGPFYKFCSEAQKDETGKPYFFIIDEINRGNISKIFGEMLMLIEADKRGQILRLLYRNEKFSVPDNLHIIGMMNTADRSIAVLDYALRRRFGFFEMSPAFDSSQFKRQMEAQESEAFNALVATIKDLNREIESDPTLGRGFAIGHSYLTLPEDTAPDETWLSSVVEDELIPLLDEYWFDEQSRVEEWSFKLRNSIDV